MSTQQEESTARAGDGFDGAPFDPVAEAMAFGDQDRQGTPDEGATLERLSALAQEMSRLQSEIAAKTVELAELQGAHDKISQSTIPDIMERLAMADFSMADGRKLEVKNKVYASITEERRPAAHAWLREHDYDGIIKTKLTAEFGKGELSKAELAQKELTALGYDSSIAETIHPATLASFVKERLENGDQIPLATFGVFERKETKITAPKKKKR